MQISYTTGLVSVKIDNKWNIFTTTTKMTLRGVMVNERDYKTIVSEFDLRVTRGVMVIVVQILDETDCISHSINTLGKGMNPIILLPAMGK